MGAQAGQLHFVEPAANVVLNNNVAIKVNAPSVGNAQAEKINLKIDNKFYRSQPYSVKKINYTFGLNTRAFKNGWHRLSVITIASGRVVSATHRQVRFQNIPLVLSNPKPDAVLTGSYTATGIVRVNADKINLKFSSKPNIVFSQPLKPDRRNTQSFNFRIDTTRLSNGPQTLTLRAVTNVGKNVKTIRQQVIVRNKVVDNSINFDATVIPLPTNGAYAGVYTFDATVPSAYSWQGRLTAISKFEKKVYENDNIKLAMDRQFYRWNNILNNQGALNPYVKATSDAGRIPMISIQTQNADGSEVSCPDGSDKRVWRCIAAGEMDDYLQQIAVQIRDSGVPKMGFTFVLEPENEIRCHNKRQVNPTYVCLPVGKGFDMGSSTDYKDAWRRLVGVFDSAGVSNVDYVWILQGAAFNPGKQVERGFETPKQMYPGNDVIDWVGADVYNTAFSSDWASMESLATNFVNWGKREAPNKPLIMPEFGAAEDPTGTDANKRANWFSASGTWLKKQNRIKAVIYFNRTEDFGRPETFRDWRIDSVAGSAQYPNYIFKQGALNNSLNGFRAFIQNSHFLDSQTPVQ